MRLSPILAIAPALGLMLLTAPAWSAKPPANGSLFDPSQAGAVAALKTESATAAAATSGSGPAIKAVFSPADYPNVQFPCPADGWNLSAYGGVEVDVSNIGASDVTAALRVDNAGDWRKSPWLTHAVNLQPGQTQRIAVFFSQPGYPLDPAHIVGLQVYLDHPKVQTTLTISDLRAFGVSTPRPITTTYSTPADKLRPDTIPSWIGKRPPVAGDWVQTLNENFNGNTVDPKLWGEKSPGWNGLISGETHRYSPQNVIVHGGILRIKCEKRTGHEFDDPSLPSRNFTTGQLLGYGKWTQRYGYFEARMKLPTARGLWPAFWMMPDRGPGSKVDRGTTYDGGMEFDILEDLSEWGPGRYNVAVHWDGYGADHQSWGDDRTYYGPTKSGWHTWGLLWLPGKAVWYCDGVKKAEIDSPRVGSVPDYIILCVQMGGWATTNVDTAHLPDYFDVDYVRAWQLKSLMKPAK